MTSSRTAARVGVAICALWFGIQSAGCRAKEEAVPAPQQSVAAAPAAVRSSTEPERPKVVILGDSLTAGLGLLESQAYPALLQQKLDAAGYKFEVENAGVSGDTSARGLRRLDWAMQGSVRVLIVALGGNDGLRGLSAADMKKNLSEIIDRARARNVTVILAGMEAPPNYGQEYAAAFRQVYRDVSRQEHVILIPFLLDKVAGHPDLNQPDGIHPNVRGAQIVADTVWSALQPILDQLAASS
jgi:acyl-CoA thioesterase I